MSTLYYNSEKSDEYILISNTLKNMMDKLRTNDSDIVILCIGSDRSTGDSLGPLIGYKLADASFDNVYIYGTIHNPINATNLGCSVKFVNEFHNNPFIIAIDSCLGLAEHVGYITISDGPLYPGLSTKIKLPKVGDINITGIVNTYSNNNSLLLQTTRLSTVMTMADTIANAIKHYCSKCF